jgi:hypothetical protein
LFLPRFWWLCYDFKQISVSFSPVGRTVFCNERPLSIGFDYDTVNTHRFFASLTMTIRDSKEGFESYNIELARFHPNGILISHATRENR